MTLTELKYIVTLAEEKHFGKAAERCRVSQPTLSVAVKKLEDELSVSLFERSKSQVTVTDTGQRVIDQAYRVLDQVGVIKDIAQEGKDQLSAPLRIGAIYSIGPYLFPHLMPELHRVAPKMPLYIEENYTSVLREKLKQSALDAIIVALPFSEPEVVTLPLYDEPFVVLLPKGHPLSKLSAIKGEHLLEDNLLLLGPGHCFRDQVLGVCPQVERAVNQPSLRDGKPQLVTEGSSLETIRHMVASGFGITVLPYSAALGRADVDDMLVVKPFESPQPYRSVALAWRVTFPRPQAMDTVALAAGQCRVVDK